jgi:integrase
LALSEFEQRFSDKLERRVKFGELAERSRDLYQSVADKFFDRMVELKIQTLAEITPKAAEDYVLWRKESILTKGGSGRGLQTEWTTVQAIFNFGVEEKLIAESPLKGRYRADVDQPPPDPFTEGETLCLASHAVGNMDVPYNILLWTGLRGSDAAALTWSSINWTKQTITTQTRKRRVWVTIPVSAKLHSVLSAHAKTQRGYPEDQIMPGMTRAKLYKLMTELGRRAGVKNCHPHRFRTTLACSMLGKGASLFDVSKLLGDAHNTVEKYYAAVTDPQQDRVRNILDSGGQNQQPVVD